MRFAEAGQTKQTAHGLAQIADRLVRGHERQPRTLDGLLAVQPPQTIAQRQGFHLLQHGGKAIADAVGLAQQACAAPHQFFEVIRRYAQTNHLRIQRQFLRGALKQLEQGFGCAGPAQRLAQISLAKGTGEQLQQTQMFVGLGGNANRQIDDLAIAPIHALWELQQTHAGGMHQFTGVRSAVGNGYTLAQKGRTLSLTRLQAL